MAKFDWERVRREDLIRRRGAEQIRPEDRAVPRRKKRVKQARGKKAGIGKRLAKRFEKNARRPRKLVGAPKQEPLDYARDEIIRIEAEKAARKAARELARQRPAAKEECSLHL